MLISLKKLLIAVLLVISLPFIAFGGLSVSAISMMTDKDTSDVNEFEPYKKSSRTPSNSSGITRQTEELFDRNPNDPVIIQHNNQKFHRAFRG